MATATPKSIRVKGPIISTAKGKALFVSSPHASQFDPNKQEATILLTEEDANVIKGQLQEFMDSQEVKDSKIKDTGFVEASFKADTDADGNPTGLLRLKAKTAMQYPAKLYSANGTVFTPDVGFKIPNRADIRMSFRVEVMTTSMFTGMVFRLQAIKIIDMPTFDDGMGGDEDAGAGSFVAPTAGAAGGFEAPVDTEGSGWE